MLSKLFRPRLSTHDPHAPLELRPTSGQSSTNKSPSKLVMKFKAVQKALRISRLNSKGGDQARETSQRTYSPSPCDQRQRNLKANLEPGPFTAEDYGSRRASPTLSHHELGSNVISIMGTSQNGAPMTTQAAHPEPNWPINPFPIPVALALTTLAKSSSRFYECFPSYEVEEEALADTAHIVNVRHAEARELRAKPATNVIPHSQSTTQRSGTAVAAHQPAEGQRVHATEDNAESERRRVESRNKWWEVGGNLRNTKRHSRREAVDFGNPHGPYCNSQQIAQEGHALKRGRPNKRRDQPQNHHSPKDLQGPTPSAGGGPIIFLDTAKNAPSTIGNSVFKLHSNGSRFIEMFEAPDQPVGTWIDEGNPTRDSTARRPVSTTPHGLGSLDTNVVLGGGTQELHQADAAEDSEDSNSFSDDNAAQVSRPGSSWWFGEIEYSPSQTQGSSQL